MLFALLVKIITTTLLTRIDNFQLYTAIAHFTGTKLVVSNITMGLIINPNRLILPVIGIENLEVIEKINVPATCRTLLLV